MWSGSHAVGGRDTHGLDLITVTKRSEPLVTISCASICSCAMTTGHNITKVYTPVVARDTLLHTHIVKPQPMILIQIATLFFFSLSYLHKYLTWNTIIIVTWVGCHASSRSLQPRDQAHVSLHLLHWQAGSIPLAPHGKPHRLQNDYHNKCG